MSVLTRYDMASMTATTIELPTAAPPRKRAQTPLNAYGDALQAYLDSAIAERQLDAARASVITAGLASGGLVVTVLLFGCQSAERVAFRLTYGFKPYCEWLSGGDFYVADTGCVIGVFEFTPNESENGNEQ